MSPAPLDPLRAMKEAITSLEEQVKARVTSVENGRKFQSSGKGEASMPDGAAIFETTGAWEDFATPSRDLRLLIAMDVVRGFPDRVVRRPERYAMPRGKSPSGGEGRTGRVLASELASRKFSYPRSDGSPWTLTLKDVIDRVTELEMAYNVNDCVELRWGAPEKSEEASTCKRYAPQAARQDAGIPRLVQRAAPAAAGVAPDEQQAEPLFLRPLPVGEGMKACPQTLMGEGDKPIDGPIPLTHHCIVALPSGPLPKGEGATMEAGLAGCLGGGFISAPRDSAPSLRARCR